MRHAARSPITRINWRTLAPARIYGTPSWTAIPRIRRAAGIDWAAAGMAPAIDRAGADMRAAGSAIARIYGAPARAAIAGVDRPAAAGHGPAADLDILLVDFADDNDFGHGARLLAAKAFLNFCSMSCTNVQSFSFSANLPC
jgi:hypothetical protein